KAEDAGWHDAKARIAHELADLTLLPRVGTNERARAHFMGITRWDDPRLSAAMLGLNDKEPALLDAVLDVNRDGGTPLRPQRLRDGDWRARARRGEARSLVARGAEQLREGLRQRARAPPRPRVASAPLV